MSNSLRPVFPCFRATRELIEVKQICPLCQDVSNVVVPRDGYDSWSRGMYIRDALPGISSEDREILMTGLHPECWDEVTDFASNACMPLERFASGWDRV